MPAAPCSHASRASSGGLHALDEHRQSGLCGDPLELAPRQRRRDLREHVGRRQVAAAERSHRQLRRNGEARAQVPFATARDRRVDGDDQRREAVVARLRDQIARHARVAHHVELKPALCARRRDFLGGRRRDRREAHDRPCAPRGARGRRLAVRVCEPLERDGRDEQRHRHRVTEHGRLRRAVGDVDEHARPERVPTVRVDVVSKRALVARATREVAVARLRRAALQLPTRSRRR